MGISILIWRLYYPTQQNIITKMHQNIKQAINIKSSHSNVRRKLLPVQVDTEVARHLFETNEISVYSPLPLYEGQKMFVSYVIQCLKNSHNGIIQSPTGTGKTLSLLCSTLSYLVHEQKTKGAQALRIIFTSRTHAQLKQITQQISKSGYKVKMAILASRDHTCINQQLKQLSGNGKELQCRLRVMKKQGRECKYYHHEDYYQKMANKGKIADLQEISYLGKTNQFCPFFYQKFCKNIANLILMPYNYLFDEKITNNQQLSSLVQGSIIIFDEAHNIPSSCQNSKQITISLNTLSRALQHLNELRGHKLEELHPPKVKKSAKQPPISAQQQNAIKIISNCTVNELQLHAGYLSNLHSHIQNLDIPPQQPGLVMSSSQFLTCLDNGTKDCNFGKISAKITQLNCTANNIRADLYDKPYWALESWFGLLSRVAEMIKLHQKKEYAVCQVIYSGSDILINIFCLDPRICFQSLKKMRPKSIIMTSGTLSPLNSFASQFSGQGQGCVQFQKPLACPHIMSKEQVNGCILANGPLNRKLNFMYQNRGNKQLYEDLGVVLVDIITKTPNGVVIFVPSYAMLETIKQQLTNNGTMSKLYAKKTIFVEKSNSSDFKQVLQKYFTQASSQKGAVLFALARGKISQGLDFSDQKCRAVILIGVPYPSSQNIKIKQKMRYLDKCHQQCPKSMTGNQWYISETIRTINQAIGRIIRNKEDYGSIYLIDQRFKKQEIYSQISSWARDCLKIIDKYDQFKARLDIFKQYFQKKKQQVQQVQFFFTSHRGTKLTNKPNPYLKSVSSVSSISKPIHTVKTELSSKPTIIPSKQLKQLKLHLPVGGIEQPQQKQKQKQKQKQGQKQKSYQKILFANRKQLLTPKPTLKQCPICRQDKILIKNMVCIHEICQYCWDVWLKKDLRCPICRVRIREKFLIKQNN